jgi:beta-N-acetylhexosaminidase
MTQELAADPALGRLADAVLIPPFPGPRAPGWVRQALTGGLAGVTLFGLNVTDRAQLARLTHSLRAATVSAATVSATTVSAATVSATTAAPVIAIDEEGGDVTRISHQTGSDYPGNSALGAADDITLTESVYAALGADLRAVGISLDLAPAVDVNTAADNPVIGTRSFGSDPALVARHAAAAVAGLQSAGVAACAKHFPGHGSTTLDSHLVVATVDAPLNLLRQRDLPPFAAAIEAGVRAIMPSHLRVPELTGDLPASLSQRALTGLLRGELGFTGVIVSDGLEMRAVSARYGIPEAAVLAVMAGTDLLCLGRDQDQQMCLRVKAALVEAVRSGRLPGARLEEAAARVDELRAWITAAANSAISRESAASGPGPAGPAGRRAVGLAAARRAVRVEGSIPAPRDPLVVQLVPPANLAVGDVPWGLRPWVPVGSYREVSTGSPGGIGRPERAQQAGPAQPGRRAEPGGPAQPGEATGRTLIIVVRDAHRHLAAREAVAALLAARPDAVLVEMGLPAWQPPAGAYVASYGASRSSAQAVAEILGLTAS